jgi:hypothetical protein
LDNIVQWSKELREHFEILMIDDGSPAGWQVQDVMNNLGVDGYGASVEIQQMLKGSDNNMPWHVHRIEQDIPWNIGGARNLAMHLAPTETVLLMDMDVLIPADVAMYLVQLKKQIATRSSQEKDIIYHPFDRMKDGYFMSRHVPHPAIILLNKSTYWKIGGCDEDFVGNYGETDPHVRFRAERTRGVQLVDVSSEMKALNIVMPGMSENQNICPPSFTTCHNNMGPPPKPPVRTKANKKLLAQKLQGKVPWSNEYLRFSWSRVHLLV